MKPQQSVWPDLGALRALGFGPDAALMNEPKLFVDRRFLAALLVQLEDDLGPGAARAALFQIGLLHGLRDAHRVLRGEFLPRRPGLDPIAPVTSASATPLAIRLGARRGLPPHGALRLSGAWPECHEADARLSRLGPAERAGCDLSAGYTSGWLSGTFDADVLVVEETCLACGDADCTFDAREVEAWQASGDPRVRRLLESVDFALFREIAAHPPEIAAPADEFDDHGAFDRDAPVVHVWGPVMIMPFTGAEDALQAIEMLSQDAGTTEIRAVVVDLRDAPLDAAWGGAALDQVVEVIGAWGAEAILAGVSSLNEEAVEGVEARHLLVRKDLPEAIAVAFQIASAQRSAV